MKLYGFWRSLATYRVKVALALKGMQVDEVSIDLLKGKQHEKEYTAVNPQAVGLGVSVFLQISRESQVRAALDSFENAVRDRPQVLQCYAMTGAWDYLLRVVLPDIEALEKFLVNELSRIPGISRIQSSFALKQVKYQTALPVHIPRQGRGRPGIRPRERRK